MHPAGFIAAAKYTPAGAMSQACRTHACCLRTLTNEFERIYAYAVAQRKRIRYEPFGEPEVRAYEEQLTQEHGGIWTGYHEGVAVPGAALWTQVQRDESSGRLVLTGLLLLTTGALTADQLRKIRVDAIENSANLTHGGDPRAELAKLPPLKRTAGMAPEEFSRLVAEHYRLWARAVPHPVSAMAAEYGVPVPTVHTWIREARLRGLLPPAQRRKSRGERQ
jgi:hypothetical protein